MEHDHRAALATFMVTESVVRGQNIALDDAEAQHARVRRLSVGDHVRLVDGAGHVASATLVRLVKSQATAAVEEVRAIDPHPAIHLMVPIADRDRMLWLAEKAAELEIASWRPILWRRSKSVSPRGEGVNFQDRVRSRMIAALTQSGGAWLPAMYPDASLERAIAATPSGKRYLLDQNGVPLATQAIEAPVSVALGPEGGVETSETELMAAAGFVAVNLAPHTLRFETAGVVALGMIRAVLDAAAYREKHNV